MREKGLEKLKQNTNKTNITKTSKQSKNIFPLTRTISLELVRLFSNQI